MPSCVGEKCGRAPAPVLWAALGALVAVGPALWMWGFTVDDALISVRYALRIAAGLGWRFNAHDPSTDGVTPLPWPVVLAALALHGALHGTSADALIVLTRAKALGVVAWGCAGAALGASIGRVRDAPGWARVAGLVSVGLSIPVAAYAASGMETPLATALATIAAVLVGRPTMAGLLAGLAASLRPEMAPWAGALAVGAAVVRREPPGRTATAATLALAPFACCAVVRAIVWGRPAPLALLARPSDVDHGLAYAGAACVVTLTPLWATAVFALKKSPAALVIVLAAVAHMAAIGAVGGDWMPYARLMVPVVPSLAYAGVLAAAVAHPIATAARSLAITALGLVLMVRGGTGGRGVGADRAALIAEARPWLMGLLRVAALDVGWVGAATDADIVDLAGLTDPQIAVLPGGHTSKRVDAMFLLARRPDALLLFAPAGLPDGGVGAWTEARYPRTVEARLARDPVIARHFVAVAWLSLGKRGGGYVLLVARPE